MKASALNSFYAPVLVLICLQSLADVARQEAERRRAIDQQGIEAKVIEMVPPGNGGNLTISDGTSSAASKRNSKEPVASKEKTSVTSIRAALQKLDRNIRQTTERLETRRARLQSERWAIPKTGRPSAGGESERTQTRLKQEIESLEKKLVQLQQERSEVYDRGRKAGFLPGEITGKGIIP